MTIKYLIITLAFTPLIVLTNEVSKQEWMQHMRSVIPTAFCQSDQYFRQCFAISSNDCQEIMSLATRSCLNEINNKLPNKLRLPD